MGRYARRVRRFVLQRVLHADDTPHQIALGVGLATIVAFLPLVGFQTIIAIGVAAACRANKAVCVPIVWITNPLTLWPIYYACFLLGRTVLPATNATTEAQIRQLGEVEVSLLAPESWKQVFHLLYGLGIELWVGCLIVGVVFGGLGYLATRWGVVRYRERRRLRMLRRNLLRAQPNKPELVRRREIA